MTVSKYGQTPLKAEICTNIIIYLKTVVRAQLGDAFCHNRAAFTGFHAHFLLQLLSSMLLRKQAALFLDFLLFFLVAKVGIIGSRD